MMGRTAGHYQVVETIGEGGMGVVHKARETRLDRFVALKVLPQGSMRRAERERRFIREARSPCRMRLCGMWGSGRRRPQPAGRTTTPGPRYDTAHERPGSSWLGLRTNEGALALGLAVLIGSTIGVGYGNYLGAHS